MEAIRRLLIGLALAGHTGFCGGTVPPPQPPTPPTPDPLPICGPEQACGCWHKPPDAPGWLYACCQPGVPGGVVNVQDPAQCAAPPTPPPDPPPPVTPPPAEGCILWGNPGAELPAYVSPPLADGKRLGDKVNDVMASLTTCSVGSRCIIVARPQVWQAHVSAGLRKLGYCAGQHATDTDEIAVQHPATKAWEGFHIYAGDGWHDPSQNGTAVWYYPINGPVTHPFVGSARPVFAPPDGGAPQPPVPPVPAGCTAPLPPKVWTAETLPPGFDPALVGHTRYVMTCRPHGRDIDCAVQNQRACAYCDSIGMGSYPDGQLRCGCPVRNECKPTEETPPQNFKCEERVACEAYLTGGTVLESRNGATCEFAHDNPFMFKPNNGNCRLCGVNGTTYNGERQGCGEWF